MLVLVSTDALPCASHALESYTRRTEILHASTVGGQSSRFLGNDYRGFDPEMGGTNSRGQLDHHQAALRCSTATAGMCAWSGYHGTAAGKQNGM